jgi:hypothetical protein
MKNSRKTLPLVSVFWMALQPVGCGVDDRAPDVTFHADVLPILQASCQACHRPGEAGPMPLLTYDDARMWAPRIQEMVGSGRMPPWFSDDPHGTFENDNRLSDQQRRMLLAWIETGTPEGDPAHAPSPPEFSEGWAIGEPDHVVALPQPFAVPAEGVIEYQGVLIPTGFTEDTWVQSIEIRPTDRRVVHHIQVYVEDYGDEHADHEHGRFSDLLAGGLPEEDDGVGFVAAAGGSEQVCTYVPGGTPCTLPQGQARLIPAGADLFLILHYQAIGTDVEDQTRIGFRLSEEPPQLRVRNFFLANYGFRIPPGESDVRVTARAMLTRPVTLVALMPHMHFRGKAFQFRLAYPDGRSEVALNVPDYDPAWQLTYFLAEPKHLPAGTTIEAVGIFDNSAGNPRNPDPTLEVRWGHQAWEEMLTGFFDVAVPADAEPTALFARPDS